MLTNPTQISFLLLPSDKKKMEVTKFDTLEELTGEFRLVQLLWNCLDEWDSLQGGWTQVRCT